MGKAEKSNPSPSNFWRFLPAGMRRRWWLFRPFDLFVRCLPLLIARQGIAVVRMDGIGDMVLFRNSLNYYGEIFGVKKSRITIVGCHSWSSIADKIFSGYKFFGLDEHKYGKNIFYRSLTNFRVRNLAPKVVILDSYFRRALIADSLVWTFAAPTSIVSYPYVNERTRPEFNYYLSFASKVIDTGLYPTHELIRHTKFLSVLSAKKITISLPTLSWSQKASCEYKSPYIILNPGSNEHGRRWPLADYIQLAKELSNQGYTIIFIGSEKLEAGRSRTMPILDNDRLVDLTGKTTLAEILDLMQGACLVVTNDTGPAHLSIGLGRPTVVIIGGGHFGSFGPYPHEVMTRKIRFLYKRMECYHCFWRCDKRRSVLESFPCISGVSVSDVKNACSEILSES